MMQRSLEFQRCRPRVPGLSCAHNQAGRLGRPLTFSKHWLPRGEIMKILLLAAALAAASTGAAFAQPSSTGSGQAYPSKPVRVIVGFPAGGGVDITARIFSAKLSEIWGSPILVETAPALADLMGGHVSAMLGNLPEQIGAIKAGKVRAVGISSVMRSPLLPNLATIAESGVPGFEVTVWYGVAAPAAVPKQVLEKIHADMIKALKMPDLQQRLLDQGVDPAPTTPEQFAAFIRSEIARWAKVAKAAGTTPQ